MKRSCRQIVLPIVIVLCYSIYFYFVCAFSYQNGWMIPRREITSANVIYTICSDTLSMLPPVAGLLIIYRRRLDVLGLRKTTLAVFLSAIYILFFFMHKEFNLPGIYSAVFYLLFVAIPEEFIYRGYLYLQLKKWNKAGAILISGLMFGYIHAILPGILNGLSFPELLTRMFTEASGGIVSGLIFIGFYELSGSLLIPILIHALLDYSAPFSAYGILVAVLTFLCLYCKKRR